MPPITGLSGSGNSASTASSSRSTGSSDGVEALAREQQRETILDKKVQEYFGGKSFNELDEKEQQNFALLYQAEQAALERQEEFEKTQQERLDSLEEDWLARAFDKDPGKPPRGYQFSGGIIA